MKNEQGLVAHPFTTFCGGWPSVLSSSDVVKSEVNPRLCGPGRLAVPDETLPLADGQVGQQAGQG